MKVVQYGEPGTFAEFCDRHNIKLVAHERSCRDRLPAWYVSAEGLLEITDGATLTSTHGNGSTPEEALEQYARLLAGHRLLIGGAHMVVAPNEWKAEKP